MFWYFTVRCGDAGHGTLRPSLFIPPSHRSALKCSALKYRYSIAWLRAAVNLMFYQVDRVIMREIIVHISYKRDINWGCGIYFQCPYLPASRNEKVGGIFMTISLQKSNALCHNDSALSLTSAAGTKGQGRSPLPEIILQLQRPKPHCNAVFNSGRYLRSEQFDYA